MKHVIMIKLEIEADAGDTVETWESAIDAVEHVLDIGVFQDTINAALQDGLVTSATCDGESAFRNAVLEEAATVAYNHGRADGLIISEKIRALK